MKTLLLAFALVISTSHIYGQEEPLPLPVDGAWQMFWYSMFNFSDNGTFAYHMNEEVNFNDTLYFPVEQYSFCGENLTPSIVFYVREDSGKWYQRSSETASEQLLFDFTLEIGDIVTLSACYGITEELHTLSVVDVEDILMYDGTTRRKWTLVYDENSFYSGNEEIWIEGIGNLYIGIIHGLSSSCVDLNTNLHCFLQQEQRVFPTNEFPEGLDCCTPVGIKEHNTHEWVTTFPNPSYDSITISSSLPIHNLRISDSIGQVACDYILTQNEKTVLVDISSFSQGVYFIFIETENGILTEQFVKE